MIINAITTCYDGKGRKLSLENIDYIIVHHTSLSKIGPDNPLPVLDDMLDAQQLAVRFRNQMELGTRGRIPYHFLIGLDGKGEQLLPLDVRGAHAIGYNGCSWGVAFVGEGKTPTKEQMETLVRLCTALEILRRGNAIITGHSRLPGASRDPYKICPCKEFDFRLLRENVLARMPLNFRELPDQTIALILREEGIQS